MNKPAYKLVFPSSAKYSFFFPNKNKNPRNNNKNTERKKPKNKIQMKSNGQHYNY